MKSYRELKVWQLGMQIATDVYKLTRQFPKHEIYGLASQMQRAACSIPSNIAEGHARSSTKELLRFLSIARGSLAELETQIILSSRLGYVSEAELTRLMEKAEEESKMLAGFRRSLESKLK